MADQKQRRASKFTLAFQASLNADEVEEACMSGVRASSEASLLDERIGGEAGDQPGESQLDRSVRTTSVIDGVAGAVSDELHRRAEMPGKGYPFQFDGKSLKYVGSRSLAYEFCLAVSRSPTITEGDFTSLPRNFERLSAITARLYLGKRSQAIRLGWPTDKEDPPGHPTDFVGRAALLKKNSPVDSDEWELAPMKDFQKVVDNANDHGMDFVAWKSFPDCRIGHLTLLGQCACGRHDQDNDAKAKELDLPSLKTVFRRLTWLDPVRTFATPYHVSEPHRLKKLHALPNLVLDRARISAICELERDDAELAGLRGRLENLIENVVGKIKPEPAATWTRPGRTRRP